MLENARSEASRRRKCSKMLAPKPPDVEKRSKMLAPKPLDVEKCSKMPAPKPLGVEKCFHGAERIIEKEIEKEFEKEFRSPALEDASLKEASLNDASLRAFNARVHTSIYLHIYVRRGISAGFLDRVRIAGPLAASKFAFSTSLAISAAPGAVMQRCVARLARCMPVAWAPGRLPERFWPRCWPRKAPCWDAISHFAAVSIFLRFSLCFSIVFLLAISFLVAGAPSAHKQSVR